MSGHRVFADIAAAGSMYHEEPDPGDTGTLGGKGAFINLISAGAETRTLADPETVGETLILHALTVGGDIVITADSGVNVAANTSLTFSTVLEYATFVSIRDGDGAYAWRIIANDGVALA